MTRPDHAASPPPLPPGLITREDHAAAQEAWATVEVSRALLSAGIFDEVTTATLFPARRSRARAVQAQASSDLRDALDTLRSLPLEALRRWLAADPPRPGLRPTLTIKRVGAATVAAGHGELVPGALLTPSPPPLCPTWWLAGDDNSREYDCSLEPGHRSPHVNLTSGDVRLGHEDALAHAAFTVIDARAADVQRVLGLAGKEPPVGARDLAALWVDFCAAAHDHTTCGWCPQDVW